MELKGKVALVRHFEQRIEWWPLVDMLDIFSNTEYLKAYVYIYAHISRPAYSIIIVWFTKGIGFLFPMTRRCCSLLGELFAMYYSDDVLSKITLKLLAFIVNINVYACAKYLYAIYLYMEYDFEMK